MHRGPCVRARVVAEAQHSQVGVVFRLEEGLKGKAGVVPRRWCFFRFLFVSLRCLFLILNCLFSFGRFLLCLQRVKDAVDKYYKDIDSDNEIDDDSYAVTVH